MYISFLKKTIIALLLLCPLTLAAQEYKDTRSGFHQWDIIGNVHAGASASMLSGANADPLFRPTGGLGVELMAKDNFSVGVELNYHWLGATNRTVKQQFEDGTTDQTNAKIWVQYIDTEYLLRWYLFKGFSCYTGLQFGYMFYCKAHANDGTRHADLKDDVHGGRFGVPVGITQNIGRFYVDVRGSYQVNKIPDNFRAKVFMGKNAHAHSAQVTIGYRFQLL